MKSSQLNLQVGDEIECFKMFLDILIIVSLRSVEARP